MRCYIIYDMCMYDIIYDITDYDIIETMISHIYLEEVS
jgi:hypothetical protein